MTQLKSQQMIALEKEIVEVDVVSFDFFDTLFVRPLCHPEDAFDILGKKFGIKDFRVLRKSAQATAFQRMHERQKKEITLACIYECFPSCGISSEELMKAEYELELMLVSPNPELIDMLAFALDAGKKVVVVSDMYLTEDFFTKAFEQHDLELVPMYISATQNATKRDYGELFDLMVKDVKCSPQRVLHIGDNKQADVKQALAKKLQAFHYKQEKVFPRPVQYSPEASIALGLIQTQFNKLLTSPAYKNGFLYGGSATYAFLRWIEEQSKKDDVDHVLFMSRDGFLLNRIVTNSDLGHVKKSDYFFGSRIAFTMASITDNNFISYIPFLLSGADGLSPYELLERIGVVAPSAEVMASFGLSDDTIISLDETVDLQRFLYAYRWKILKICKQNRQAFFNYLLELGIEEGQTIALVDVGWSGSTQESFEQALDGLMSLNVQGYYFCLSDTPESIHRQKSHNMKALLSSKSVDADVIAKIYKSRVTIETFFSAPHNTVIGLKNSNDGVVAIEDAGRGTGKDLSSHIKEIIDGGEAFFTAYDRLMKNIDFPLDNICVASPMVEFATGDDWHRSSLFSEMTNFDTWASSKNKSMEHGDYV